MKNMFVLAILAMSLPGPLLADAPMSSGAPISDPQMKRIYDADQADRSGKLMKIDWTVVGPRDAERRRETRQLLAEGRLHTGADFVEAAFVFQHGSGDDFLLAHTLAVIATKKGDPGGPWIAAATLDRYLQSIGGKQIYGTQTLFSATGWTKEPYDHDLISDSLRHELGVPDLAAQAAQSEQGKTQDTQPVVAPRMAVNTVIKCNIGPINRIYVRATWEIHSCNNGGLLATMGGEPATIIVVFVLGGKVLVAPKGGGDESEVKVVTAAFQAMTPAQITDLVDQTKAVKP